MKRLSTFLAVFIVSAAWAPAQQKTRVAVMNFDYATVQSGVQAIFGANQDIGKGIADLLVRQAGQDGKYSVIERKMLDKIIAEQNMSNSDRFDSNSAAKIGRMLGVDAIIVGSITQFGAITRRPTSAAARSAASPGGSVWAVCRRANRRLWSRSPRG